MKLLFFVSLLLMDLKQIINTLSKIDVYKEVMLVLQDKKIQDEIIRMNQEQIFVDRKQRTGEDIPSENPTPGAYSKSTEIKAIEKNGNRFTWNGITQSKIAGEGYFLLDSGEWFDSFRVEVERDSFIIKALETRGDTVMVDEYGEVLGLSEQNERFLYFVTALVIKNIFSKFDK